MELYRREKVNPVSGCLPMLIQIPVFFSLYKVLFVTIEMRQAPFFGWIHDLSAADPTTLLNLFGLLPLSACAVASFRRSCRIGIWPILMGITQWLQTKLNPAPADPVQAQHVRLHAADLHVHDGDVPGRPRASTGRGTTCSRSRSNM